MNLRKHRDDLIAALERIPVCDTKNFGKLDTLHVMQVYAQQIARAAADSIGEIASELDLESTVFVSSISIRALIYENIEQELLGAFPEAIEAAEENLALPYLQAAE